MINILKYIMRDIQEVLRLLHVENKQLKTENLKLKTDYALIKKENNRIMSQYHNSKNRS